MPIITDTPENDQPLPFWKLLFGALLSALLMNAAFPPLDLGWLAWAALIPLFYVLPRAKRTRHAFFACYLFGYAHWGWTITWVGTTVTHWAHSSVGWIAWGLLTAIKAGWWGLFGGFVWWIARRTEGARRLLTIASAWTVLEWLRGIGSLAMPWSLSGYTQYRFLPLIQASDLIGVFGIGFALALVNATLAAFWFRPHFRQTERWRLLLPAVACIMVLLVYGLARMAQPEGGKSVRLALMQPDQRSTRNDPVSPQELQAMVTGELEKLRSMNAQIVAAKPQMVVWPESGSPGDAFNEPTIRLAFVFMARASGAYQLVGSDFMDEQERPHNSAALFAPDGALLDRYDKRHLVPFGEFIPGRSWLPFADTFHFREKDVVQGTEDRVLTAGNIRVNTLICYESVFSGLARSGAARGANLLVSITNDSWAGESPQLQQHIAMAVFRAVETRRNLAASATTGITAIIDSQGHLKGIAPYRQDVFVTDAHLLDGQTLYTRWGDIFVGFAATFVAFALWRGRYLTHP